MDIYWTPEHDAAIKEYYYSTSTVERNRLIDKHLYKPLHEIARRSLTSLGLKEDEEKEQNIVIHIIYKAMPKISEDKLQGAFQYLWVASRNYILSYIIKPKVNDRLVNIDEVYTSSFTESNSQEEINRIEEIKKRVDAEIDLKLKGQRILNTTNSIFLMLLKQYLNDNDYDPKGFSSYVMKQMHLKLSTYRAIAGRLQLRTIQFNEEIEPEEPTKNRRRKVIVIKDGKAIIYSSIREAALRTKSDRRSIHNVCNGKKRHKRTNGAAWFYFDDKQKWQRELQRQNTSGGAKTHKIRKKRK